MRKPVYENATVVIPTYNRMELLDCTLASLVNCATPRDQYQVLVCDDGSSDATKAVVDYYRKILDLEYGYQDDRGFRAAEARNMALRLAKFPILIFLDSGVVVSSNFINTHVEAHKNIREPSAFIGYVYGFDRNNENHVYLRNSVDHRDVDKSIKRLASDGCVDIREEVYQLVADDISLLPAPWTLLWGYSFSVELDVMRIVDGFNQYFTTWGGEDLEFGYKLHRCGVCIVLCRDTESIHLPHAKDWRSLGKQSDQNLARETRHYSDPMIETVLALGDFGANTLS